ncbi:MAG: DUF3794 domain-containing protein [Eubacterium sp.]|nr:DUF3794 domain-containing protein [Eubacterium sp.]
METDYLKTERTVGDTLECERQQFTVLCEKGRAVSQIALDDDYNLAEYKPDITKLIEQKGQVRIEEIKTEKDLVKLRGTLHFEVLYRTNLLDGGFGSVQGDIPFQETVHMQGTQEFDNVRVNTQLEDLSVAMINSRKLEIRALITLQLQRKETCVHALATNIQHADETVQTRMMQVEALELLEQKKDISRFRTELTLPSNKPGIQEMLWYSLQPRAIESRISDGQMEISGELFVHMVYRGEEEHEQLQCLEQAVPMQVSMPVDADGQELAWVHVRLAGGELEKAEDFDGENRMLRLEAVLEIEDTLWQERTLTLLEDAYATNRELRCDCEEVMLQKLLIKNDSRFRLQERMALETEDSILQICSCIGEVQVEDVTPMENSLDIAGILKLRLLYVVANDEMPMMTVEETFPFRESVEVPGLQPQLMNFSYELEAGIDQLTSTLLDPGQVECKAQIRLCVLMLEHIKMKNMEKIEAQELDLQQMRKRPGMVGHIVKKGEKLWDIAKEHRITMEQLMEQNERSKEELLPGEKLLIVNTIG